MFVHQQILLILFWKTETYFNFAFDQKPNYTENNKSRNKYLPHLTSFEFLVAADLNNCGFILYSIGLVLLLDIQKYMGGKKSHLQQYTQL